MNVTKKADAAFMRELERTDPRRCENLQRNIRHSITLKPVESAPEHLGGRPKKHKDNAEKQRAYRNKKRNEPKCYETWRGAIHSTGLAGAKFGSGYPHSLKPRQGPWWVSGT